MKKLLLAPLALGLLAVAAGGGKVKWETDYREGLSRAKETGQPMLLYFGADWCGYCTRMSTVVFSDDSVVKAAETLVPIHVDCTQRGAHAELLKQYNVTGFPTVLFVSPKEKILERVYPRNGKGFAEKIADVIAKHGPEKTVDAFYVGHNPKYVNITFESNADLETIVGSTNRASGEIRADFAGNTGSVELTIPVASLKTGIDLRDDHLRSKMWLDAARFPLITFKSKKVKARKDGFDVTGDFTLHGVTKEIKTAVKWKRLPGRITKKAGFPEGKWLKFSTSFDVYLSDFGVTVPGRAVGKVSDTWTVKVVLFAGSGKPQRK